MIHVTFHRFVNKSLKSTLCIFDWAICWWWERGVTLNCNFQAISLLRGCYSIAFSGVFRPGRNERGYILVYVYFAHLYIISLRIHFLQKAQYPSIFNFLHVPRSRSFALCTFLNCSLEAWKKLKDGDWIVLPMEIASLNLFWSSKVASLTQTYP